MKHIAVFATALRNSGGVTIFNQFIRHLKENVGDDRYLIFKSELTEAIPIKGVEYVTVDTSSRRYRLYFDFWGCKNILKKYDFHPDLVLSLQNFGVYALRKTPQYVYFHNPLSISPQKWNFFKKTERGLFLHKHIYPLIFQLSITKDTKFFVQTDFIKRGLVRRFKIDESRVSVEFPDVEKIDSAAITPFPKEKDEIWFVYPATPLVYKKHITIVELLKLIKSRNPEIISAIKVHWTLSEGMMPDVETEIVKSGLQDNFIFHGVVTHEELLRIYKSSDGLLFPSVIETLGLPLLEAASFGLPVVVSKLGYSEAVIGKYQGVSFVEEGNLESWYKATMNIIDNRPRFENFDAAGNRSSWEDVISIISAG